MIVSDSDHLNGELVTLPVAKPSSVTVCRSLLPPIILSVVMKATQLPTGRGVGNMDATTMHALPSTVNCACDHSHPGNRS